MPDMSYSNEPMEQLLGDSYCLWVEYQKGNPPHPIPMQSAPNEHLINTSEYKKSQFQSWCLGEALSREVMNAGIFLLDKSF